MAAKIKFFFANHYLALIFALIVGLVGVWPQFAVRLSSGLPFAGAYQMFSANEDIYLARIREVVDGHFSVGSPLFYEYKNRSNLMPPIGEYVYALPTLVFKFPLNLVMIASKFILPAVLFFLVYLLILRLSLAESLAAKINAAAGGLAVVLGYDLMDPKTAWLAFSGQLNNFNLLIWTRPVNPVIGAIFLFAFLLLLWRVFAQRKKYAFISSGLVLALLSAYFFSWGLGLAVLFCLAAIALARKDYWLVKQALYVFGLGVAFSLPLWLGLINSIGSGGGKAAVLKYGMFFTHAPILNKILLAVTLVFAAVSFLIVRYDKPVWSKLGNWWWFCLALLAGGWLAYNQQIITGLTIWPYHFVQYTIPFAIVTIMALMINFIKTKFKYFWLAGMIIIFSAVVVYNAQALKDYGNFSAAYSALEQKMPLYNYLNKTAEKDCVVLSDTDANSILVPALSHCNTYAASYVVDGVPTERIKHNYLVYLRLNGVSGAGAEDYLKANQGYLRAYFYENWDQIFKPADDEWFNNLVKSTAADYREFLKKDFKTELKKYRLDYLLLGAQAELSAKTLLPGLKFINSAGGQALYKF